MKYTPFEIIAKKRDGNNLSEAEISFFLSEYLKEMIPDYQMAALLMAVYFRGMNEEELKALVDLMIHSGETIDLSEIPGFKVDKHSTGGVGDKISIVLAPLVASTGVPVPMISGRGLGHTGGTLDKLEAIPGYRTHLTVDEFKNILRKCGLSMMGQTEKIVPADRRLYALRSATATINSIPLVAGSIMSKKIAEGIQGLVLDVKTGHGAFFPDPNDAVRLGQTLKSVGQQAGLRTEAFITNMDQPLGFAIGNWLEIVESVNCLRGNGPKDVMDVTYLLARWMLILSGIVSDEKSAQTILEDKISSGAAYEKFLENVELQHGNPKIFENMDQFPLPPPIEIRAQRTGFVQEANAFELGMVSVITGAGRNRMEDQVDPGAGILMRKKIGDYVKQDEVLALLYTNLPDSEAMEMRIQDALLIGEEKKNPNRLIQGRITPKGVEQIPL
ncbi:pyrimidine-nucleoside phosphorylase [bacterium BMS3Abin05]|nr:pyrimidine-nucleoside phosphorylase [bacterium BMS3Abin05]